MPAPNIGTSVSDGYQRGVERLAATAPSVLVPALIIGVTMAVVGEAQTHFGGSISGSGFDIDIDQSAGDRLMYNLLSLVQGVILTAVGTAALAIFAGAIHRLRHEQEDSVPAPGEMVPALISTFQALLPRIWVLIGLGTLGPLAGMVANGLGALVGAGAALVSGYFSVRWVYAAVIVGSGEATGDAAYVRSEAAVAGRFWGTLGTLIVVGIGTLLPAAIVGGILFLIVPTMFVSYLVLGTMLSFVGLTIWAGAIESIWAQTEAGDDAAPSDAFGQSAAGSSSSTPAVDPRSTTADADDDSDPYA